MRQPTSLWPTTSLRRVAQVAAAAVTSMGCIVLIGWISGIPLLTSFWPGLTSMKFNTAVSFVLAGTALFSATAGSPRHHLLGWICSLAIIAIGAASLSQYLFGWNLSIDELLVPDWPTPIATVYPGRMSFPSAVGFLLVGSALWLSTTHRSPLPTLAKARCIEVLTLLSTFIAAQGLISYLYEVQPIIGVIPFTQMALATAIAFLILGPGILFLHPHRGLIGIITANSAGGATARRLLLAAIAIPLISGWIHIETTQMGLLEIDLATSILVVSNIIIFLVLIAWNARLLHQVDLQRQAAVDALYQANEDLEARVSDRTTELREANQSLRQSEERLSLAIEGSGLGMVDLDLQTGHGIWSAQYFRLLGYEPNPSGEATLEMWQERVHPDDLAEVMQMAQQAQENQTRLHLEHRVIRADNGQIAWLRIFGRYFYSPTGQATRFIGVVFDNTTKKQVQEERDRFFMLSPDMLCIAGLDGYFKQLNPAWEEVFGYTQAELMAEPFLSFVHPADLPKTQKIAKLHESGVPAIHFENRYRCKDGSYKWLSWMTAPWVETGLLYAVARDITERKQTEQQLIQQAAEINQLNVTLEQRVEKRTAQLQAANQELEAFSYTVAHDLRAPLRGMQGFSQALVEDYGDRLDDVAKSYIQRISDSADRMNTLISDLLAYSRLSRESVRLAPVSLVQVMAEAQAQIQSDLRDRSVNLTIAEPLPKVLGYRSILVQILVNLLSNAIKFVDPGKQPQIRVWTEVKDSWVRLWVEDNGIGIEPRYQERIFGVFERLHGMDAYPGTGIGLAIVRKGTERLGGRFGLESELHHGSRFWIELRGVES